MGDIHLLSDDLINKIAAGEVIERPASVVKELLENSLDAGATKVHIVLEQAGMRTISIQDNGKGMTKEDAILCIQRHATSKLKTQEDLFAIQTLGFRGEALASIAAIAKMELQTKRQSAIEGTALTIEDGEIKDIAAKGRATGTTIIIQDIFHNIPARRKYLKSEQTELQAIIDIVTRYALAHPQCAISVEHNGKKLFATPGNRSLKDAITTIYGVQVVHEMLEVHAKKEGISINGFISKPALTRAERSDQSLFVNGRYIKDKHINAAIDQAYHTLMMTGRHPLLVLDIRIDPSKIDVNVHPTKINIRIEQENELIVAVKDAITQTLEKNILISDAQVKDTTRASMQRYSMESSVQTVLESPKTLPEYRSSSHISKTDYGQTMLKRPISIVQESRLQLPNIRILGQCQKTFILAEIDGALAIIDQHVAHERVLYEEYLRMAKERSVLSQELLQPQRITLPLKEALLLKEHMKIFQDLGFEIEELNDEFILRQVPVIQDRELSSDIIKDMLAGITDKVDPHENTPIADTIDSVAARMSCKSAVKAGDELTLPQMHRILGQLLNTKNPYSCPHGRPIIIRMTYYDLEKMFKRH